MTVRWYGKQVQAQLRASVYAPRLEKAGRILRDEAKVLCNRAQPIAGKGSKRRGLDPSEPGQMPKRVSGDLVKSISMDFNRQALRVRVGSNVRHAKYLELGTRKMKRRPWLSRAVKNTQGKIAAAMGGKL